MSTLEELQRKMYAKTPAVADRPEGNLSQERMPGGEAGWKKQFGRSSFWRNTWLFISAFFIIVGGLTFLIFGTGGFSQAKVLVAIDAPKEASGVGIVEWNVTVSNQNRTALQDVTLTFEYPEHALPVDENQLQGRSARRALGTIEGRKDAARVFKARLFGEEDEIKKVRALITFKTPGISRDFEKEVFSQVKIVSSPITLAFQGPQKLENGAQASWHISLRNLSDFDFQDLRVRVDYPKGFSFGGADPAPQFQNNHWEVSSLKIGQEKAIDIRGSLAGSLGEDKDFHAYLEFPVQEGRYVMLTQKVATTSIGLSPLALTLSAQGGPSFVAHAGQTFHLEVSYRNNASDPVNDVAITGEIISEAVSPTSIQTQGRLNPSGMSVRWDYTNTPELKEVLPGKGGKVDLSLAIKDKLLIKQISDKNFTIRFLVSIVSDNPSPTLPAVGVPKKQELVIPLATNLSLQLDGDYREGPFTNIGGIPPLANRQTTYTIYWRLINTSNDINDLSLVATLPAWASFNGLKQANFNADNLYYDKDKRQMVWTIKKLPATTGVVLPVYEAAFQIAITPGNEHLGSIIDVLGSTQLKGIDSFTNEVISTLSPPIKTDLAGKLRKGQATVSQ